MKKDTAVIILAAGKGKRMKSEMPKVLHPVCGRPMIGYVFDLAKDLKPYKTIVVLGHKYKEVQDFIQCRGGPCVRPFIGHNIKSVVQKQLIGTADAVQQALSLLKSFSGNVLVLYGDVPLLKKETIEKLLKQHIENKSIATLMTANVADASGYGRIIRDKYWSICSIVEDKDANEFQKEIKEINTGIVCFDKDKLSRALKNVRADNRKKEYYLTDVIGILYKMGFLIDYMNLADINEALGINSRVDLAKANSFMRQRINKKYMEQGVTIIDPVSTHINHGVEIGIDTVIYPFTVIEKNVKIGNKCSIGPFARLREGTRLDNNVVVGNFLEIARSKLGQNTLAKHFSYIGDSIIGQGVNIGAGTVTANFDGKNKNTTIIKDEAFIGSDTVLVAPVKIGKGAKTGAGSVVTRNNNVADYKTVAGVPARNIKQKTEK
ncbi:MAG: NTP transferase domain-containing protein [Candidatus Omnitrophota bacterium]